MTSSPPSARRRPARLRTTTPGLLALLALWAGCSTPVEPVDPPEPSFEQFENQVYPVLLRDCAFPDCHGNPDRFFNVYGPGRARLAPPDGEMPPVVTALKQDHEVRAAYDRATSMLAAVPTPDESRLLRKPLASSAGGGAHKGVDAFGRNVYESKEDPGWVAIAEWARGEMSE